jgi:uncharacterized phage-associated protein
MISVHDIAVFVLQELGRITAMKLQRLVYYAQAWALTWDEEPLFHDRIEAWANGPIVPSLYHAHQGKFVVSVSDFRDGKTERVTGKARSTMFGVLMFYGDKDAQWLSDLTKAERPWKDAREGLAPGERGGREITREAMGAYYSEL